MKERLQRIYEAFPDREEREIREAILRLDRRLGRAPKTEEDLIDRIGEVLDGRFVSHFSPPDPYGRRAFQRMLEGSRDFGWFCDKMDRIFEGLDVDFDGQTATVELEDGTVEMTLKGSHDYEVGDVVEVWQDEERTISKKGEIVECEFPTLYRVDYADASPVQVHPDFIT